MTKNLDEVQYLKWMAMAAKNQQRNEVFGMSMINAPWVPNAKDGRVLLDEIMLSGNFGNPDTRMEGLYASKWNTFWMVNTKTFRFWRFDHGAWFRSPVWRVYHFIWKKINGFTK